MHKQKKYSIYSAGFYELPESTFRHLGCETYLLVKLAPVLIRLQTLSRRRPAAVSFTGFLAAVKRMPHL